MSRTITETRPTDEERPISEISNDASAHPGEGAAVGAATSGGVMTGSQEQLVTENEKAVPLTKWQRYKKHFRRRWYIYMIVNVILLAIILPVFFVVIIPFIMQKVVDGGKLPIFYGEIEAVNPGTARLGLSTQFPGLSGLKVKIDGFNASLYNKDVGDKDHPYVRFPIPDESYKGNHNITIPAVDVKVENETQIVYWLSQLLHRDEWQLSLDAHTHAHLGALKGKIHIKKTVKFPALSDFHTIRVPETELLAPALPSGDNLRGSLRLNNSSPLVVNIGNLTLNAMAGEYKLGEFKVDNFVAPPGVKDMPFHGTLSLGSLASNLPAVLKTQKQYLTRGVLGLTMSGKSVLVNNQHIGYVEQVLNPTKIATEIALSSLLGGIVTGVRSGDLQLPSLLTDLVEDLPGDNTQLMSMLQKYGFTSSS